MALNYTRHSGIPESVLRQREYYRQQFGVPDPSILKPTQTVEEFLKAGGHIKVYPPTCSIKHKKQKYLKLYKEDI